ncbi:MAG: ribonuclease HI family protein [Chloroflexota bacterium]
MSASIDQLVEEIRHLSPSSRRQLLRRLQINDLLDLDDPVCDRNPLRVAPALGFPTLHAQLTNTNSANVSSAHSASSRTTDGITTSANVTLSQPEGIRIEPTPVGGKIVVGAPQDKQDDASANNPHAMAPVPGQAPEKPIRIVFDGGSKGNPGYGYGSYALEWPGQPQQVVRLQLGNSITNNEAEYDTLIMALEAILKRLHAEGAAPNTAQLDIRGDSKLVIQQVLGAWKCNEERLRRRRNKAQKLLAQFDRWRLQHHKREKSVEVLGH